MGFFWKTSEETRNRAIQLRGVESRAPGGAWRRVPTERQSAGYAAPNVRRRCAVVAADGAVEIG
jgi:hypothetical protein